MAAMFEEQTEADKRFQEYQEGKTRKVEDFGVMLPDGSITWGAFSRVLPAGTGFSIDTAEGQKEWLKEYLRIYNELHVDPVTPKVLPTFVKRVIKTSYSSFLPNNLA